MKARIGLLTVLALLLHGGTVFAQSSDYEIIEAFKKSHQSLLGAIKAAHDAEQCVALGGGIDGLEAQYEQHRKLLIEGLYPETLDTTIAALREQLNKATERVALAEENKKAQATIEVISRQAVEDGKKIEVISRQNEEYRVSLEKLTQEVGALTARIQRLSDENTGLLENIKTLQRENKKDKESIARLEELTGKLNANLRDRDGLIMAMMDALFNEYSKAELTDAQKQNLFVNAQSNDYVGKIIATVDGNIKYLASYPLTPRDVKLIGDEQSRLAAKWGEIKPFVARLYPDEQIKEQELAAVDGRLSDWKKSIGQATWKSIHQVFVGKDIDIGAFQSADEFQTRLLAYIDQQMTKPSRGTYKAFKSRVWDSPITDQWLPVIPTEELSQQQRSDIENRIALWDKAISAGLRRWLLIAFGAAVLIGLVAVIALKKKKE